MCFTNTFVFLDGFRIRVINIVCFLLADSCIVIKINCRAIVKAPNSCTLVRLYLTHVYVDDYDGV